LRLRDYQEKAADFLYENDRAMILAPVGAGKTALTLTAMQDMLRYGFVKRWLVLAPKRVCTDVWPVEQPKWATDMPLAVAVGTPAQRAQALHSGFPVVVTNYDNIQWLAEQNLDFDGNVIHFNEDDMLWFKEIDMPRASFISNKDCFAFHPLATSLDHAIKIATERRQELLRNNEWTCDPVEWNKIQQKKKTITSFLPQ